MRAKKIVQTGIMLAGLAALPIMAQTTAPGMGGTTTQSAPETTGRTGTERHERGFNFGWLGLIGLAGLLGLRRHGHRTDTSSRM